MNLVIDLAQHGVCGLVVEHRSAESEGLRFDSSWGLGFFLCPRLVTRQKHLSLYKTYFDYVWGKWFCRPLKLLLSRKFGIGAGHHCCPQASFCRTLSLFYLKFNTPIIINLFVSFQDSLVNLYFTCSFKSIILPMMYIIKWRTEPSCPEVNPGVFISLLKSHLRMIFPILF